MMREGVFIGQVNVSHPWEAIPKSKHVEKETGVCLLISITHT
jgi:hypothetical protein